MPRLLQAAFWAAIAFTFICAVVPQADAPQVPAWDKAVHAVCFFVLTGLGVAAYPRRVGWVFAGLAFFGALIELVQAIPAVHRDAEVPDWVADLIGIAAAGVPGLFALPKIRRVEDAGR